MFHYLTYEPGENIITEGERGLTFYIIISGTCIVHKKVTNYLPTSYMSAYAIDRILEQLPRLVKGRALEKLH